jgi:phage tail-like protein
MPPPDLDSSVGHTFSLELDGVLIVGISVASSFRLEQDVVEFREVEGNLILLPGHPKAGAVTFTRSLTVDGAFDRWVQETRAADRGSRRNAAVVVHDRSGTAIKRYHLANAWPKSLEIGALVPDDTTELVEQLTIVFEGLLAE